MSEAKPAPPSPESGRTSPTPFLIAGVVLVVGGVLLGLLAPVRTQVLCTRGSGLDITCRIAEENRLGPRDHGAATSEDWATVDDGGQGVILRGGEKALRLPFEPKDAERFAAEFRQFLDGGESVFTFTYDEPEGAATVFGLTTLIGLILVGVGALMRTTPNAFAKRSKKEA